MNRILAHTLKHLMTTVPILVGLFFMVGSAGAYELENIGTMQFVIQTAIGPCLFAIGCAILNYFEN